MPYRSVFRPDLFAGGEDRAANQAPQILALGDESLEIAELLLDLVNGLGFKRDVEKGLCVTGSNTGSER